MRFSTLDKFQKSTSKFFTRAVGSLSTLLSKSLDICL